MLKTITIISLLMAMVTGVAAGPQNTSSDKNEKGRPFNAVLLYEEDFSDNQLPEGWLITDLTQSGHVWSLENQMARANSNFDGSGDVHVHTQMFSSAMNFSDQDVVILAMHHRYVNWLAQRGRIWISTDNVNWTMVKEYSSTTGPVLAWETLDVSQWAAGESTVYFQWEFDDSQVFGYHWTINEVILYTPFDQDLNGVAVAGSVGPVVGEENTFEVIVRNEGAATQENYLVHLYDAQDNLIGTQPGVPIDYLQEISFSFQWIPQQTGVTWLYGFVELEDDQIPANNQTPNFTVNVQQFPTNAYVIGDSTGVNTQLPVAFSSLSSFTQTIYFENEFDGGGLLTTLAYKNHFTSEPVNNTPLKIWIGETTQENLNNGWIPMDDMVLVFDSLVSFPMGTNNIYIDLSEPFLHSGGNLVISVLRPLAMWGFGGASFVIGETPGTPNRTRRTTSNSQQINPGNPGTGTLTSQLPQTTFFLVQAGLGQLSGTVTNMDGNPLLGATVEIEGTSFSTTTAVNGTYAFPWLLAGEYTVTVSRHGYMTQSLEVEIMEDETTLLDVALEPLVYISLSGMVMSDDGSQSPVGGATITLYGMAEHEAVSQSDGSFSFHNIFGNVTYDVHVKAAGYQDYSTQLAAEGDDMALDFLITEFPVPAFTLQANAATTYAQVSWPDPKKFRENAIVLDDGTGENGYSSAPGYSMWLGNRFPMSTKSMIRSIELFGLPHPYGWNREVTIDIFDEFKNHVFKTDPLVITPYEWKKVDLPMIPMEGTFYAMVHWHMFTTNTHHVGFDQTGPNVNNNIGYFYDGDEWYLMHVVTMGDPGVFMIRVNAFVEGEDKLLGDGDTGQFGKGEKELLHFTLHRRITAQQKDEEPQWEAVGGEHTALSFTDYDWYTLDEGMYEYGLKAVYSNDNTSVMRVSEPVEKVAAMAHQISFNVVAGQDDDADAFITLTHSDPLEDIQYDGQASQAGSLVFPQVYEGTYQLLATLEGYDDYFLEAFHVNQTMQVDIALIPTHTVDHLAENISVFPNPARDFVWFTSPANIDRILLINAEGRVVKELQTDSLSGTIRLDDLPQGAYMLRLISGERIIHRQVVIAR